MRRPYYPVTPFKHRLVILMALGLGVLAVVNGGEGVRLLLRALLN